MPSNKYMQDRPIFPIDVIPKTGHPLSTPNIIDQTASACNHIPGSNDPTDQAGMAKWFWWNYTALSTVGFLNPAHAKVESMPGVNAFYAYSYPYSWSANTGLENANTIDLFFVMDAAKRHYQFYIIDEAWDGSGGSYEMRLSASQPVVHAGQQPNDIKFFDKWDRPLAQASVLTSDLPDEGDLPIMLRDDPWNTYEYVGYNDNKGHYTFKWKWLDCCTDGMILGPMPSSGALKLGEQFTVTYEGECDQMEGLAQGTRISMWNPRGPAYTSSGSGCEKTLAIDNANSASGWIHYDVPMHQSCSWTRGIQIHGERCEDHCARYTNCGECSAQLMCGWDDSNKSCKSTCDGASTTLTDYKKPDGYNPVNPTTGEVEEGKGRTCSVCAAISDPFKCMCEPGCGWAPLEDDPVEHLRMGKCISGTPDYPSDQTVKVVQWETKGCARDCGVARPDAPPPDWNGLPPTGQNAACCPVDGKRSQCYRAAYNEKKAFAQWKLMDEYPVLPATSYPAEHPKATVPPKPLPAKDLWACAGASSGGKSVDGAVAFFAYNFPNPASSNTKFETSESVVTFLTQDDTCQTYLLVLVDKPNDGTGGYLQMDLTTSGLNAEGPGPIAILNDPYGTGGLCDNDNQAQSTPKDKYSYSSTYKNGTVYWTWGECCNDGMVIGPLPYEKDWSVNMKVVPKESRGLETFRIGTYDADRNDLGFVEAKLQKATSGWGGLQYDGLECTSWCQRYTDCASCFKDEQCQFSAAHGGCVAADAYIYDYGCARPAAAPATKVMHRSGEAYERESVLDGFDAGLTIRYERPAGLDMSCPCGNRYRYFTTVYEVVPEDTTGLDRGMKPILTTEGVQPRFDYEYTFVDHGSATTTTMIIGKEYHLYTYLCVKQGTLARDDCSPASIVSYTHAVYPPPPPPPTR